MLTFIARMTVKADREQEFLRLAEALTEKIHAHEPDCIYFRFFRLRDGEQRYAALESFRNEAAGEAHRETAWFKELVPPILECLDGTFEQEYLDPLET